MTQRDIGWALMGVDPAKLEVSAADGDAYVLKVPGDVSFDLGQGGFGTFIITPPWTPRDEFMLDVFDRNGAYVRSFRSYAMPGIATLYRTIAPGWRPPQRPGAKIKAFLRKLGSLW